MTGLEVIGGISATITLLDASIKIYDSAKNDIELPKTFDVVRSRLPVILYTIQMCKDDLEPFKHSMPSDACVTLEQTIKACDANAVKLKDIFEQVIPGDKDA